MPQLIYQLPTTPSFFESIVSLPNGTLLVTRQDVPELWSLNPISKTGSCIAHIPAVQSLTGLAELSADVYVVGGGTYRVANHEGSVPGSYSIWLIDLSNPDASPAEKVRKVASVPEIGQVNGVERWDEQTVLVADSYFGKVYRVDVGSGTCEVCFEDEATTDAPGAPLRMSVNGIKVRWDAEQGRKYMYFTNTTRLGFYRVPVAADEGGKVQANGPVEILASGYFPAEHVAGTAFEALGVKSEHVEEGAAPWFMPDDFCFAEDGTAFITSHPTNMVFRTVKGGGVMRIAGDLKDWEVAAATACAFGKGEEDRGTLYVCTAGANVVPIDGKTEGAKVVAFEV